MTKLTPSEMTIMLEALTVWESKSAVGEVLADLMGAGLAITPEDKIEHERRKAERHKKNDEDRKMRHEQSVMIQAKLITMRDQMVVDDLTR